MYIHCELSCKIDTNCPPSRLNSSHVTCIAFNFPKLYMFLREVTIFYSSTGQLHFKLFATKRTPFNYQHLLPSLPHSLPHSFPPSLTPSFTPSLLPSLTPSLTRTNKIFSQIINQSHELTNIKSIHSQSTTHSKTSHSPHHHHHHQYHTPPPSRRHSRLLTQTHTGIHFP